MYGTQQHDGVAKTVERVHDLWISNAMGQESYTQARGEKDQAEDGGEGE